MNIALQSKWPGAVGAARAVVQTSAKGLNMGKLQDLAGYPNGTAARVLRNVSNWGGPGCWPWSGTKTGKGYGTIKVGGKMRLAHRVLFELLQRARLTWSGPAETGPVCVLHRCDNPECIRPGHLFLGSRRDNIRDAVSKGRNRNGQMMQTHCRHGHPLSGDNLRLLRRRGGRVDRVCVECRRRTSREWARKQR